MSSWQEELKELSRQGEIEALKEMIDADIDAVHIEELKLLDMYRDLNERLNEYFSKTKKHTHIGNLRGAL